MTRRDHAPVGAPCWIDLWTSDVEGSRAFYAELFGWSAEAPSEEFGGYFMFMLDGAPVAGGMGDMGEMKANDAWKVYFRSDDIAATLAAATAAGGTVVAPTMQVADLGSQAVLIDPDGAPVGVWQPDAFPGFLVTDVHGTPSWFELQTRDYAGSLEFYRATFGWTTTVVGDAPDFQYAAVRPAGVDTDFGGVMNAAAFLPDPVGAVWHVYWHVDDIDTTVADVVRLGGSVVLPVEDTPYGRLAGVADPSGAEFKLRQV